MVVFSNSYRVNQNFQPEQDEMHPNNSDVSTDTSQYKPQEQFTADSVDPSLPYEAQETSTSEVEESLTAQSSSEERSNEEQTISMEENHFGDSVDKNDDDIAYFKCLATIAYDVSDELVVSTSNGNSCIPTANKDLIAIKENLELPLQAYSHHQENLTTVKLANRQVKRQCKCLKKVIDKLSEEKGIQISLAMPTHRFLNQPGFQEYMKSRDIQNLMHAIEKLNKAASTRRAMTQCKIS